jgi:hypothetical protein
MALRPGRPFTEEKVMRSVKTAGQMFADVPRPWGLAGAMTIVLWLLLVVAFVTDAVPSSSSEEWLYNVEAHRAAWAQHLSVREVQAPAKVALARPASERPN